MTDKNEIERLNAIVAELAAECAELRAALAKSEQQRDEYLKVIDQYDREKYEKNEFDYDQLVRMSAGPVEMIE